MKKSIFHIYARESPLDSACAFSDKHFPLGMSSRGKNSALIFSLRNCVRSKASSLIGLCDKGENLFLWSKLFQLIATTMPARPESLKRHWEGRDSREALSHADLTRPRVAKRFLPNFNIRLSFRTQHASIRKVYVVRGYICEIHVEP